MAGLPGHRSILAIKQAATWHTAVAAGALDGLLANSEDVFSSYTKTRIDPAEVGVPFLKRSIQGRIEVGGSFNHDLRYDGGIPKLLAAVMGDDEVTTPVNGVLTRDHQLWDTTAAPDTVPVTNDGKFFTVARQTDDGKVHEVPSWKPMGFTITGNNGEVPQVTVPGIGDNVTDDSSFNTTGSITAVSIDSTAEKQHAMIDPSVCKMQLSTAAADNLAGSAVAITGFELSVDRAHERAYPFDSTATSIETNEPLAGGTRAMVGTLTLNFDIEDTDTNALFDALQADTEYIGLLTLQGGLIEQVTPDYYYSLFAEFRSMRVMSGLPVALSGQGKLNPSVTFALESESATAYTGLNTFDGPVGIRLRNIATSAHIT